MIAFYQFKNGWRWRVTASNGKIIGASSEAFCSKQAAQLNAQRLSAALKAWDW